MAGGLIEKAKIQNLQVQEPNYPCKLLMGRVRGNKLVVLSFAASGSQKTTNQSMNRELGLENYEQKAVGDNSVFGGIAGASAGNIRIRDLGRESAWANARSASSAGDGQCRARGDRSKVYFLVTGSNAN